MWLCVVQAFDSKRKGSAAFRAAVVRAQYVWPEGVKVDDKLKDLVNQMLDTDANKRLGAQSTIFGDGLYWENYLIRDHPFMSVAKWREIAQRRVLVSAGGFLKACRC